jgi:hypothetical protein
MREYELYIPLSYNDGRSIEPEKHIELKRRLVETFGGLTHFLQENEGLWKVGSFTFRDKIMIYRVLADDAPAVTTFFVDLRKHLEATWQQKEVLIVSREVVLV